ncbi:hypothetical protein PGTUg99_009798 [Puccinia graminis f. sp. tritici]|uniref:Uncharacterized protein n=1 Tax=Puccinia graminis f. sp. tritici TaxID=56615 RepID=A0A5B0PW59_PUCGR|nr:hypothetical protein PGTUg99_009798 [Puccinia graminis f. sp. tritici]
MHACGPSDLPSSLVGIPRAGRPREALPRRIMVQDWVARRHASSATGYKMSFTGEASPLATGYTMNGQDPGASDCEPPRTSPIAKDLTVVPW